MLKAEEMQSLKTVLLDYPSSRYGGESIGWLTRIAIQYVFDTYGTDYTKN